MVKIPLEVEGTKGVKEKSKREREEKYSKFHNIFHSIVLL